MHPARTHLSQGTDHVHTSHSGRSATYVAVLGSDGDLVTAVADMDCFDELTDAQVSG